MVRKTGFPRSCTNTTCTGHNKGLGMLSTTFRLSSCKTMENPYTSLLTWSTIQHSQLLLCLVQLVQDHQVEPNLRFRIYILLSKVLVYQLLCQRQKELVCSAIALRVSSLWAAR
jgi:hypothetical protein